MLLLLFVCVRTFLLPAPAPASFFFRRFFLWRGFSALGAATNASTGLRRRSLTTRFARLIVGFFFLQGAVGTWVLVVARWPRWWQRDAQAPWSLHGGVPSQQIGGPAC